MQSHKKVFYIYIGCKTKANRKVDLFLSGEGDLATQNMEESEAYKVFFLQVL